MLLSRAWALSRCVVFVPDRLTAEEGAHGAGRDGFTGARDAMAKPGLSGSAAACARGMERSLKTKNRTRHCCHVRSVSSPYIRR